jgi:hypothetical protein
MTGVHILAIDFAKRGFEVCGTALGGACVDAPVLQGAFDGCDGLALLTLAYRASCCGLILPRPGMQFEERVPHRFIEL